jgi:hypothetical protein
MLACPYCHQPAMSQWRKSFLGPALSTPCRACGRRVSVSWLAMLGMLPPIAGVIAAVLLLRYSGLASLAALVAGIAGTFWMHAFRVPLVKRDG